MKLVYHRLAVRDVREVLDYYENEAGGHLADRFFDEFLAIIDKIRTNPRHYPPLSDTGLRRANLISFPYHILYEERSWGIKVMVIRHHRRNPSYGLRRQ
jgi:plasmid stabilization system protein ParE